MDSLKWLWGYAKKYTFGLIIAVLLICVFIILTFSYPILVGRFVDEVIENNKHSLLFFYVAVIMGLVLLKEIIKYFRSLMLHKISEDIQRSVRKNLFHKLQSLDSYFYDKNRTGDLMSRITMDTSAIGSVLTSTLPEIIYQVSCIIIGFIILFSISVPTTLCLFSVLPFLFYIVSKFKKNARETFISRREANAQLNTHVRDNIEGNRIVKAYGMEEAEIEKFNEKNENYKKSFMEYIYVWCKYSPLITFIKQLTSVIFILTGGYFVMTETITIGEFATINGCLWYITTPMEVLGNLINGYQQFVASSIKIIKLEQEEPIITNKNVKKRDTGIIGKIEFRNVSFSYDSERAVRNLNFSINPGETLAIIGPTGSGKSTILNLLTRFYDTEYGSVYIDDINVKNIDLATLRKNVTSAMQDVFLFSDTIRNNIAFGTPGATDDDIIRVSKMANAHDFISQMPEGYDTVIGERGVGLSGGQKQRISLARALLKNPPILVLDDTTSALDMETEFNIQENLKNTHTTKIIIAHRISSVKNADLILVLNHGRLIEWGNHETLMKQKGYYKGVFEHQFGNFNHLKTSHVEHPGEVYLMSKGGGK